MIYASIEDSTNSINLLGVGFGIFFLYLTREVNYSGIKNRTKEWNKAIEERNMKPLRKEYMTTGKFFTLLGATMGTWSLLVTTNNYFESLYDNGYVKVLFNSALILGITFFASGLFFIRRAKRLDKAVFEEDIKKVLSSPLIVSPMIRPDYSGIMVVKRF
ncbi:hypothetical protein ES702_05980 [subsurface metagenome]